MIARAIQDQKAIAPKRLYNKLSRVRQSSPQVHTRGTRLQPSICDLITFSTMPKRSNWANHSTGRAPEGNPAKFFGRLQQSEILAQRQSPRIAFKVKAESSSWIEPCRL
jgi:hypothetical protein